MCSLIESFHVAHNPGCTLESISSLASIEDWGEYAGCTLAARQRSASQLVFPRPLFLQRSLALFRAGYPGALRRQKFPLTYALLLRFLAGVHHLPGLSIDLFKVRIGHQTTP